MKYSKVLEEYLDLKKTLQQATDRFTEEFDLVRTELVALNEAKTRDSVAINNLNKTVNAIQQDIINIAERHSAAETKLHSLDNTANKNKERNNKLELRVDKLEDLENSVRILNEQEKRKKLFCCSQKQTSSLLTQYIFWKG